METKFKHGDLVKIRTTSEPVMVIEYKINMTGNVANSLVKSNKYPKDVITDEILCEGIIGGKFQRQYIKEASLELIQPIQ